MVFTLPCVQHMVLAGFLSWRDTANQVTALIIESMVAATVAISNIFILVVMISGWRKLMKNNFYIIVANMIVFTSMKCFVELAFVIPYYVIQRENNRMSNPFGIFTYKYELLIFNVSVLADYGVLFFSLLLAINRYFSVASSSQDNDYPRLKTVASCGVMWICTSVIPLLFFIFECQYEYDPSYKIYYNHCNTTSHLFRCILNTLIYMSYTVALIVMLLSLRTFLLFHSKRRKRSKSSQSSRSASMQLKLLQQSAVIFSLYAASTLCIFALSFVDSTAYFELVYAENLLNLSIAGIYPICLLFMSGEMRTVLVAKIAPRPPARMASISIVNPISPLANFENIFH